MRDIGTGTTSETIASEFEVHYDTNNRDSCQIHGHVRSDSYEDMLCSTGLSSSNVCQRCGSRSMTRYGPEVEKAMSDVQFIAEHVRREDEFERVST